MNPTSILLAFITGLTTGGLSCFAVQGGLLTSSIASFAEKRQTSRAQLVQPILLFLTSKLVIHAIFGFLLGLLGTVLSPSPIARGILQLAIGIFMVGNALRMLDVHPFFRVFTIEPPHAITRMIRQKAKKGKKGQKGSIPAERTTPIFLGALTILIPCGITQIMMATAISTGNPWMGAAILSAFVLGASPTFFGVTYLATRISALFEKQFMRILAVVILLLGFYTFDTGLNLSGSPFSITRAIASFGENQNPAAPGTVNGQSPNQILPQVVTDGLATPDSSTAQTGDPATLRIDVLNSGYRPRLIQAQAGKALHLKLVTKGVYSCSRAFVIPDLNIQKLLPDTGETTLEIPAQAAGTTLHFTCSMGMYSGDIAFQ